MPWEDSLAEASEETGNLIGTGATPEINADARYTFSVPDLIRRQAHRAQYKQYF